MLILTVVAAAVSLAGLRILKNEERMGGPKMLFDSKEQIERDERRRRGLGVAAVVAAGFVVLILLWGAVVTVIDCWL